jgi:hypothetical protein
MLRRTCWSIGRVNWRSCLLEAHSVSSVPSVVRIKITTEETENTEFVFNFSVSSVSSVVNSVPAFIS